MQTSCLMRGVRNAPRFRFLASQCLSSLAAGHLRRGGAYAGPLAALGMKPIDRDVL